jgi:hypothetical protein
MSWIMTAEKESTTPLGMAAAKTLTITRTVLGSKKPNLIWLLLKALGILDTHVVARNPCYSYDTLALIQEVRAGWQIWQKEPDSEGPDAGSATEDVEDEFPALGLHGGREFRNAHGDV